MTDVPLTFRKRLLLAAKIVQVRLRFVFVLLGAFLVVGQWGVLRNHWDRIVHRLSGKAPAAHSVSGDTEYFCPMDPGVLSDWPAICPVCNMDLVRRKKGEAAILPEGVVARMQFSPYRIQLAGIKTSILEPRQLADDIVLAVPETAVIDTGTRQVVYVETMPGMFDGMEVALGPRQGDYFPVLRGLEAGQKVATYGAFLIDAEARLNPSLAAGYFGATQSNDASPARASAPTTTPSWPAPSAARSKLSSADQALADKQKVCPVTNLPLNSMGGPVPVEVAGRKVFICCKGCQGKLKSDPQKYLAKLKIAE